MMSPNRLKAQSLSEGANNILIAAVTGANHQIGHCFVSQWMHEGDRVWWITQLVVHSEYQAQSKATRVSRCSATAERYEKLTVPRCLKLWLYVMISARIRTIVIFLVF